MSTDMRKKIKEHIARHHYHDIPVRASAHRAPDTDEQPASTPYPIASQMPPSHRRTPPPRPVEEDNDDEVYETRKPSSTRRYKPLMGTQLSALESLKARRGPSPVLATVLILLSLTLGILGALIVPPLWQRGMDQWNYHFPRTYQVDVNVGHGTANAQSSHFIAINNHGVMEVVELPTALPSPNDLHLNILCANIIV